MFQLVNEFKNEYGREDLFCEATKEQYEQLEKLIGKNVYNIIDFYKQNQPHNIPMLKSYVRLLDIEHIIHENTELIPGKYLAQCGFFVFATTVGGNVLCIDSVSSKDGDANVYIADYMFCEYNEKLDCVEICIVPENVELEKNQEGIIELNHENIVRCLKKVDDSYFTFMEKLSRNEYEDIEAFLD